MDICVCMGMLLGDHKCRGVGYPASRSDGGWGLGDPCRAKSRQQSDKNYNEIIHIKNEFANLMETNTKIHVKLDEIHNKILTSASEKMSSDILDEIWNGEEELWDEFYLQSKKD